MPLDEYDYYQNINNFRATYRKVKNDFIYKMHR